jgi:hypothetical protein
MSNIKLETKIRSDLFHESHGTLDNISNDNIPELITVNKIYLEHYRYNFSDYSLHIILLIIEGVTFFIFIM